MATYTITPPQLGVWSIALAANTVVTVSAPGDRDRMMEVGVVSGTAPVYARLGTTVSVQDPLGVEVPVNFSRVVGSDITNTIALVTSAAAVVSIWVNQDND